MLPVSEDKKAAYAAMHKAIRDGLMPPARTLRCESCSDQATDYHHPRGYEPAHWLDVVALCPLHHHRLHGRPGVSQRAYAVPPGATLHPERRLSHLRRFRRRRGLTATALFRMTGIPYGTICGMEGGNTEPLAVTVTLLADALGVAPSSLCKGPAETVDAWLAKAGQRPGPKPKQEDS